MQSKTSFFNKTIFRKNLTRFAPVWVLYIICLVTGLMLVYGDSSSRNLHLEYYFPGDMVSLIQLMSVVNIGYALVTAQLLFGDLFQSRMANALHALPLRRETWYGTHVLSGLLFSLVPTLFLAVPAAFLLMGSFYENGWMIALWWYVAVNLQYVVFFGLAVFSAMCTANRFTMAAGYGLLNAGAYIAYFLIDTVYTPLLYGVITPTTLVNNLTPVYKMVDDSLLDLETRSELIEKFGEDLEGAVATFTLTDRWIPLLLWVAAGIAFLAVGLALYRKRDLECAGDAVAFSWLKPVFRVLCALFVSAASQFLLENFFGMRAFHYGVLALGLVIGWFIANMLIERSTRVFNRKNFLGLAALAAAVAVTLGLTWLDVLGIEDRIPKAERIVSVTFKPGNTYGKTCEDPEDIQAMLTLHALALEERSDTDGGHVLQDGQWVLFSDTNGTITGEEINSMDFRYAASIRLYYTLDNGNRMMRRYNVWVDSPAGELMEETLTTWEHIGERTTRDRNNREVKVLDALLNQKIEYFDVNYFTYKGETSILNRETVESFLEAVKLDCAEGTMAQHPYFHIGRFQIPRQRPTEDSKYYDHDSLRINISSETYSWDVAVYPDSRHSLKWLQEYYGLPGLEILPDAIGYR